MHQLTARKGCFSIRRHAVQLLLRQALDRAPSPVHGLLGGHAHSVEHVHALAPTAGEEDCARIVRDWRQQGIELLAAYTSDTKALPPGIAAYAERLPVLLINSDTEGRIEASLLAAPAGESSRAPALEMQEDGGLYPSGDKG